jgi:Holliday junction resolvase
MTADIDEPKRNAQQQYKAIRNKLGRKPSLSDFSRESGISKGRLELIYGRNAYSKLVTDCGDLPEEFGKPKSDLRSILETWGTLARELKTLPVGADWAQRRLTPTKTGIKASHGITWSELANEFLREFGRETEWQDVVALIPSSAPAFQGEHSKELDALPLFVSQFLSPIVSDVVALSQSEDTANDFERKVSLVFQMLGFEVAALGQGTGRNPDAIAKATQEHFGLIIDAKARNEAYVMGTEDRKFIEYIRQHQPALTRAGCKKLYFVIVSSRFAGRDMTSIIRVKQETQVPVVEIRADQLLRILAFTIENPLLFDRRKFEQLLLREGELTDSVVDKILKK